MIEQKEQDALDQLYVAVQRLRIHGCSLDYILSEVENAYDTENEQLEEALHEPL